MKRENNKWKRKQHQEHGFLGGGWMVGNRLPNMLLKNTSGS